MEGELIKCRAKVSPDCYDGRESRPVYGSRGMVEDNTHQDGSVVCDACYLLVTMISDGTLHEIPAVVNRLRVGILGPLVNQKWTDEQHITLASLIAKHKGERPEKITDDQEEITNHELETGDIVAHYPNAKTVITRDGMSVSIPSFS